MRTLPSGEQARAVRVPEPPVTVPLGTAPVVIDGREVVAGLSARLYDFGIVSVRVAIDVPDGMPWEQYAAFGRALAAAHADLAALLLDERRPLSPTARRDLLAHRYAHWADHLVVLTRANALVVDPAASETDIEYTLEFAQAQFFALRLQDAVLEAGLPRICAAAAALARRGAARTRIDRKLAIVRDSYGMLNDQGQASRAEMLELAIVLLILLDILLPRVTPR